MPIGSFFDTVEVRGSRSLAPTSEVPTPPSYAAFSFASTFKNCCEMLYVLLFCAITSAALCLLSGTVLEAGTRPSGSTRRFPNTARRRQPT
jgi:hypothetical protein